MKQIDICMATDDNYAPYAGVVISSMLEHLSEDYNLVVHVLDGGVSAINKAYLEEYKQKAAQTLSARAPAKKTNANRQPETAVSYDIQSAEQKAALGAPVYERKKKK